MRATVHACAEHALILGSNQQRARHLRLAFRRIAERFDIVDRTPALRTRDASGTRYLNAALRIRSPWPADALRDAMHAIEDASGRKRGVQAVTLDIDIVASIEADGGLVVHKPEDLARGYVRNLLGRIRFPST